MRFSLTYSGLEWLRPAVALVGVALLVLWWAYAAAATARLRWTGFGLKTAALAALAWCLLEPLWLGQRAKPGANLFAVIADNSEGLQIHDRDETRSRGDVVRELVTPRAGDWQSTLAETFDVRRYLFDTRLQPTDDFHELTFDGRSTALGAALRTLRERYSGRPLAGVLLLTDGNATDLPGGAMPDLAGLPPIYPVVIGRPDEIRDIAVRNVNVAQAAFEDAPVSVQAEVAAAGYRGEALVARLLDRTGRVVQERNAVARGGPEGTGFRFQLESARSGISFYQLEVGTRAELGQAAAGGSARTDEATLANNRRVLVVDRGQGPFRILYVSGRPNWEFKFLSRAIQADGQLELVGLIRVAKREPKFEFRGHAGERSNPLFRGFGRQAPEEVERYDQPVLVRLNTRDDAELRAGFPRTPEDLYAYHAVILDDVEAGFFSPDQALLLQKFVSERGGGVLMLGGTESFADGNYDRTPIGDLLPVYLDGGDPGPMPVSPGVAGVAGGVHLQLAREGWLQPWARLRDNAADERTRLERMPAFDVVNRVGGLKPGASVIATVRDERGAEYPAVAVQRFGRGRSAAMMLGDVWRWGMQDAATRVDMEKSWRQLARWLVSDVPARVQCTVEPLAAEQGGAVRIQVRVRDEKFQPVDDATVAVDVETAGFGPAGATGQEKLRLAAEPAAGEAGLYEAAYVPRRTGGYLATAQVTGATGVDLGRAQAGWSSDLAAEEFRALTPNVALLQEIARRTGGRIVPADELASFARRLPRQAAPVMETWSYPAWHTPVLFAFALTCLVAEWGLRRWKGLP